MSDIWVTTWPTQRGNGSPTPNELIHDTEAEADACEARLRGAGVGQVVVYVRAAGVTG